jgi:hypothetical protein
MDGDAVEEVNVLALPSKKKKGSPCERALYKRKKILNVPINFEHSATYLLLYTFRTLIFEHRGDCSSTFTIDN